MPIFKKVKYQ